MSNNNKSIDDARKEIEALEKLMQQTEEDLECMAVLKRRLLDAIAS